MTTTDAATTHAQLHVEQRITEDALGIQTAVVAIQPDRAWLLQQLLAACDDDPEVWHHLRRARWTLTQLSPGRRAEILACIVDRPALEAAWTMTQTLDETEQLRALIDEEGVEPDRCRSIGCGRYAVDPSGYCDADLDGRS